MSSTKEEQNIKTVLGDLLTDMHGNKDNIDSFFSIYTIEGRVITSIGGDRTSILANLGYILHQLLGAEGLAKYIDVLKNFNQNYENLTKS